ncbi:uncharacterized protein [Oryza sativa Japonica Group]|uniref:uncharacterized protein n=1 Tax=Oryza sativa subsp. japonica TaxID=39947 RepID=UPI00339C4805
MEFYQLPEGVHKRFDKIRNRYYWAGNKLKGKYHMVRWEDMAFPKDFGGLGFSETRRMNIALLAKWIIKIESDEKSLRSFGPAEITEWEELKKLCGHLETTNHILFNCVMARLIWCICRDALGWNWKKLFRPKEEARLELMTDRIKMVSTSLRSPRMGVD